MPRGKAKTHFVPALQSSPEKEVLNLPSIVIECPVCHGSWHGMGKGCYNCQLRGYLHEPDLTSGKMRRWVRVAHALASNPPLSAREIDSLLAHAYGVGSVAGILGAMREGGIVEREYPPKGTPTWHLTEGGYSWQLWWCPECFLRRPNHKKACSRPEPIWNEKKEIAASQEPSALSALLPKGEKIIREEIDLDHNKVIAEIKDDKIELTLPGQKTLKLEFNQASRLAEALLRLKTNSD